jgi:hypothetical protein
VNNIYDLSNQDFDDAGKLVGSWINKAKQLLASSKFLQKNCIDGRMFLMSGIEAIDYADDENNDFGNVYLMLKGMALECFLKAILIKQKKIDFNNGSMKPKYNNHLLLEMAKDSGIELNVIEEETIKILSEEIYLGRYPVFKNCSKHNSLPFVPNAKIANKNGDLVPFKGISWTSKNQSASEDILKKIYFLL